jgi:hypothetical protein
MLRDHGLDPGGTGGGGGQAGGPGEQVSGKASGSTTVIPVATTLGGPASGSKTKLEERDEEKEGNGVADGSGDMRDWAQSHLVSRMQRDRSFTFR